MPKIAVNSESVLITKALELFLKDKITQESNATLLISDREQQTHLPQLIIGREIPKPFTKEQLFDTIDHYKKLELIRSSIQALHTNSEEIDKLIQKFISELLILTKKNK